ncbi:MAG: tRNA dihydrouridine synthase DusB [Candidatus Peribacteraceae bacterium]|nr:tRNA dihydrouridine synthase DusB [Candidatus Peribacteraceae bacterium]
MLDWKKAPRPIIALAPMAGYTDSAFRQLIRHFSKRTILWSEFVSADALKFDSKKSKQMLAFAKREQPFVAQIFGRRPENFVEAAKFVESIGASGVDLNFGCPAKKVVNSDHGSALLKNPKLASEIISMVAKSVKIPTSVKMRLGIADDKNLENFAKMVESSGAQLLTIHGRTAKQMYRGEADFEPIYRVKKLLQIPVLGNGDIDSVDKFFNQLGNLDGLMIGRAAVTNPWIFREIENRLAGKDSRTPKTLKAKIPTILKHARLLVDTKGEKRAMLEMRKFSANYVRGEAGAKKLRAKLVRTEKLSELERILRRP